MNKKHRMFVRMVLASLLRRRSRMIVALLAIVVGATILSGLGLIYYDVPRQMSSQFRSYGANVILTPSGSSDMNENEIEKSISLLPAENFSGCQLWFLRQGCLRDLTSTRQPICVSNSEKE